VTRTELARHNEPMRLTIVCPRRCGTAFMRYLGVGVEILPTTSPDPVGGKVIPDLDISAVPGINRAAGESVGVGHAT